LQVANAGDEARGRKGGEETKRLRARGTERRAGSRACPPGPLSPISTTSGAGDGVTGDSLPPGHRAQRKHEATFVKPSWLCVLVANAGDEAKERPGD
jgi:hypothetical protein